MAVQLYDKSSTTKLSKNFSAREFRCGLGGPCNCANTLIDDKLVEYLQKIRDYFGVEVEITSGYRCASYNSRIGAASGSRHTHGMAADIVVAGIAPARVAAYAESIGVLGIGLYESSKDGFFVHIDTRGYKSFWYGQAQKPRTTFGGAEAAASMSPTAATTAANGYTLGEFIRDVQEACGATVDGVAGPETLSKTVTISAKIHQAHDVVYAVQRRLRALGYTQVGTADGIAGPKFTEALTAFQKKTGCTPDGEATAKGQTWAKLLGMA